MLMCNGQSIVVVAGGVKRDFARKCANGAHACGDDEAVCDRLRPESCGFRRRCLVATAFDAAARVWVRAWSWAGRAIGLGEREMVARCCCARD
jgi:hypothetical protein